MMSKNTQFIASWAAVSIVAESTGAAVALVVAALSWVGAIPVVLLEAFLLAGGQRWVLRGQHAGLERGWFFATLAGTLLGRSVQFAADGSGIAAAVAMMPTAVQAARDLPSFPIRRSSDLAAFSSPLRAAASRRPSQ